MDVVLSGRAAKPKAQSLVGTLSFEFSMDDSLLDVVLPHFLSSLAPSWDARHENGLTTNDIRLTFFSNISFKGSLNMTLREFVQIHLDFPFAKAMPPVLKQSARSIGPFPAFLYFELHVQQDLFENRTNEDMNITSGKGHAGGKRKKNGHDENERPIKRIHGGGGIAMLSTFNPPADYVSPVAQPLRTKVTLYRTAYTVSDDGEVSLDESTREALQSPSFIHDSSLGQGVMKTVYQLDSPGHTYVVKRFHRMSPKEDKAVSVADNNRLLLDELKLLGCIKWLLASFYEYGKQQGVDLDTSLIVTEAWYAIEDVANTKPCHASGVSDDDYDVDVRDSGVAWLLEPRRSGGVMKYCGTVLGSKFKPVQGRLAATIYAFIHFAWLYSKKSILLCDVQTMIIRQDGKELNVIFDPMAHTPKGCSGPGDHGDKGIKDFIEHHKCTTKCESLGLDALEDDLEDLDLE
ncbi:kinase-like domain-containing protein [Mycena pura]|uniref:Kinase-like domain-containing protein n=1 Tax=Mycena pura TaxID=153505 RepID=A0AAD6Y774_9AGAR|nr:kinase-like domain-containing protein [Mycena pura]